MTIEEYLAHGAPEGQRNHSLFKFVMRARELGWDIQGLEALKDRARRDGLGESEVNRTYQSAMARPVTAYHYVHDDNPVRPLEWDGVISGGVTEKKTAVPPPAQDWQENDLARFLNSLFCVSEVVPYTMGAEWDGHKWVPQGKGSYTQTAQDIIDNPPMVRDAGAGGWIRINPFDGEGVSDSNITDYRHALVESDSVSLEKQLAIYRSLELPCAAITHSGGKSIHAIVKVDAQSIEEYRDRVKTLYNVLHAHGIEIDRQNSNPSRLSRIPGVMRGNKPQYVIDTDCGLPDFQAWLKKYASEEKDTSEDFPRIEPIRFGIENPPTPDPVIIDGLLTRGCTMQISGPSKCGKSYALIALCASISTGGKWMGRDCMQGRALYVNLELKPNTLYKRLEYMRDSGLEMDQDRFQCLHLRGFDVDVPKLCDIILQNIVGGPGFDVVVLDPLYKLNRGDENSARDMSAFFATIESMQARLGTTICMAHHFAKGHAGSKQSMDRGSGSGVLARAPDAIGSMTPLEDHEGFFEVEWTLREFPMVQPETVYFDHPIHRIVERPEGAKKEGEGGRPKAFRHDHLREVLGSNGHRMTVEQAAEWLKCSDKSIRRAVNSMDGYAIKNGKIVAIDESVNND